MANTDKLKKTIEDLDLQRTAEQLAQLAQQAEQTARQAVAKAGELTHANRDKVDGVIEKVSEAINLLTKGKAAPHLAKAKAQVAKGIDMLEEQRPQTRQRPTTPPPPPSAASAPADEDAPTTD
jgi:chromosome segregation and condensation protein ScpB